MVLEQKNDNLVLNICRVYIRSVDQVVNIPALKAIYHTPSRISYSNNSNPSENGQLVNKMLRMSYPGLGADDFKKFNKLSKGAYQVYMELENGEVYEVAPTQFPMVCSTSFDINRGHELVFSSTSPTEARYITTNAPGEGPDILKEMFNYEFDFNLA